jgi:hypothetical protein
MVPSRTKRSSTTVISPRARRRSREPQWVVAVRPASRPAACSRNAPVQTERTAWHAPPRVDTNSSSLALPTSVRVPCPPRNEQVVERRTGGEGGVRVQRQALGTGDRSPRFRDHQALGAPCLLMPERQQFPGADEVEFLDPGKTQQSEGHGAATAVGGGCWTGVPLSTMTAVRKAGTGSPEPPKLV